MFDLHLRLAGDTLPICELELCEVRLLNDSRFPWIILIPRQNGLTEVHQLSKADQQRLIRESSLASEALMTMSSVEKINVGALGNVVSQLHWHVVGRSKQDPCWPGPVWGCGQNEHWSEAEAEALISTLRRQLEGD